VANEPGTGRDEEAVRRFIERFALTLTESGMARMPARAFAAILTADDGRCTAAELASLLGVSPAAVSGAVRYLTQLRLVRREREPGERRDHYRISTGTWYEAVARREEMIARWEQDLAEGIKAVGPGSPAGDRLDETRRFFEFFRHTLERALLDWRELRGAGRSGPPAPDPARSAGVDDGVERERRPVVDAGAALDQAAGRELAGQAHPEALHHRP
jgi:DNA-binding transcriptional regulator GbsR (MarR family)